MKSFKAIGLAVILTVALGSTALAGTITFNGVNEAKSFTYSNTGTTPFAVNGLSIQTLFIGSTPYSISGGTLNVSSGTRVSSTPVGTSTIISFAPGGGVTVSGAIPSLSIVSGTLLTGTFDASQAVFTTSPSGGSFGGALTITYINPYIFSGDILSASDAQTILNVKLSGNTFTGVISTSDVTVETPEPGSLALLGFGALALPWSLRKQIFNR